MRFRSLAPLVVALLAAGLTGCGSSARPGSQAAPRQPGAPTAPAATPSATVAAGKDAPATARPGSVASPTAAATGAVPGTGKQPGAKPSATSSARPASEAVDPRYRATEQEIPIDAAVEPRCVLQGGQATLNVKTVPKAKIAFLAMYAGEKSGAAPPWGEGYGGNDTGDANHQGEWQYTWTVAPNAPVGNGRVMVVVGTERKQRAIDVPFSVGGREAGGCGT